MSRRVGSTTILPHDSILQHCCGMLVLYYQAGRHLCAGLQLLAGHSQTVAPYKRARWESRFGGHSPPPPPIGERRSGQHAGDPAAGVLGEPFYADVVQRRRPVLHRRQHNHERPIGRLNLCRPLAAPRGGGRVLFPIEIKIQLSYVNI